MEGTILRSTKTSEMSVVTWRKPTVETGKRRSRLHSLLIRVSVNLSKGNRSVTRIQRK